MGLKCLPLCFEVFSSTGLRIDTVCIQSLVILDLLNVSFRGFFSSTVWGDLRFLWFINIESGIPLSLLVCGSEWISPFYGFLGSFDVVHCLKYFESSSYRSV